MKKIEKNLVIGAVQFTQKYGLNKKKVPIKKLKEILNYLNKKKLNYIDEAINYNFLDYAFDKKLKVSNYKIITKIPSIKNLKSFNKVLSILQKSLYKSKKKKYYAILLHDTVNISENQIKKDVESLRKLKEKKITLFTGISVYNLKDFFKITKFYKPDIVQVPLNIIDQDFLDSKFQKYVKKNEIKVHARSIFLKGSLLQKRNNFLKINKEINFLDTICKNYRISRMDALVSYVLNINFVDKIVIGVADLEQLKEIIKSKIIKFKKNEFSNMNVIKEIKKPYLWKK